MMEVIDLMEDDPPQKVLTAGHGGELDRVNCRIGRKAANQITNDYPQYEWVVINSVVQAFCNENPGIHDKATIVKRCLERLDPSQHAPDLVPTTSSSAQPTSVKNEPITISDSAGETQEDDFDDVCLISKSTPLLEVLRLFPNAKKDAVNALLEKHGFEVHAVVQTMLDSGYEKEEQEDSQELPSDSKPSIKHDFTSNSWETSASYRKDAVNELQRNFPFLTQAGLQVYFKKEKHHFYHTLTGIEKRIKVAGLYFAHSRVQNLLVAIVGESAENKNTTTSTSSTTVGTGTANNSTTSSPTVATKDVKSEPQVIDLFDSQPQTLDFTDTITTTTTTTTATTPSSSTKSKAKGKAGSAARMLSAYNSKFLSKEHAAELRKRCDKNETGLCVRSVVLSTYTTSSSSAEDSSLSYLMQPLDSVLQAEIDFLTELRHKELLQQDQQAAELLNEQIATDEGSLMECGCCYGEYAFEALVQCSEGHLFCKQCLQRYAEQTVFGNGRSSLKCMCTAEACEGFFSDSMLRHSLPDKVFEKFSQALSRDALSAVQLEGLVTCHHCSMQMLMEEDAGSVVHCPYCRHETCRLCNEKSHVPLRCSEVEKKSDTSARLSVEEAMTQARLRECLKCKTKFFKVEGCNKMTCRCGAHICYVCRKDITKAGYAHFCQAPHCKHKDCGKCVLYSDSLEDDRIAMKEAGLQKLLEEQQKQQQEEEEKGKGGKGAAAGTAGADGRGTGVNKPGVVGLDLEKLLEGGALKKGPAAAVRGAGAHANFAVHPGVRAGVGRAGAAVAGVVPGPAGGFGVGAQVMNFLHDAIGGLYGGNHNRAFAAQQAAQQAEYQAQQLAYQRQQQQWAQQVEAQRVAAQNVAARAAAKHQQQLDRAAARQHQAQEKAAQKAAAEERRRLAQVARTQQLAETARLAEEAARQQAAERAAAAERLRREAAAADAQAFALAQRNAQNLKSEAEAAAKRARAADEAAFAASRKRTHAMAQFDAAAAVPVVRVPAVEPLRRAATAPAPPLLVAAAPGPPPPPPPMVGLGLLGMRPLPPGPYLPMRLGAAPGPPPPPPPGAGLLHQPRGAGAGAGGFTSTFTTSPSPPDSTYVKTERNKRVKVETKKER